MPSLHQRHIDGPQLHIYAHYIYGLVYRGMKVLGYVPVIIGWCSKTFYCLLQASTLIGSCCAQGRQLLHTVLMAVNVT